MNELEKKNDFKLNHLKIIDEYTNFVEENQKAPTITKLSELTNLTRPTIYKHMKHMQLNEISNKYKIRAFTVLEGLAKKAEEGDPAAVKLFFQLAFNFNEKKIMDVQTTNRSIKVVFTNPSNDDLKKITETEDVKYEELEENE